MKTTVKRSAAAIALLSAMALPLSANAGLMDLTSLFVFGDSLSDGGNSGTAHSAIHRQSSHRLSATSLLQRPILQRSGRGGISVELVQPRQSRRLPALTGPQAPTTRSAERLPAPPTTTRSQQSPVSTGVLPSTTLGSHDKCRPSPPSSPAFNPATSLFVVGFSRMMCSPPAAPPPPWGAPGSPGGPDIVKNGIANILTTILILAAAGR